MTRIDRLIHGPFERRRDIPSRERVEAGNCRCQLCEERGVQRRYDGLVRVRQAHIDRLRDWERAAAGPKPPVTVQSPLYLMDLSGLGMARASDSSQP